MVCNSWILFWLCQSSFAKHANDQVYQIVNYTKMADLWLNELHVRQILLQLRSN